MYGSSIIRLPLIVVSRLDHFHRAHNTLWETCSMPYCYDLYPGSFNNMCGRSGFLIHGGGCSDNPSEGCIVIESESTRYMIKVGAIQPVYLAMIIIIDYLIVFFDRVGPLSKWSPRLDDAAGRHNSISLSSLYPLPIIKVKLTQAYWHRMK